MKKYVPQTKHMPQKSKWNVKLLAELYGNAKIPEIPLFSHALDWTAWWLHPCSGTNNCHRQKDTRRQLLWQSEKNAHAKSTFEWFTLPWTITVIGSVVVLKSNYILDSLVEVVFFPRSWYFTSVLFLCFSFVRCRAIFVFSYMFYFICASSGVFLWLSKCCFSLLSLFAVALFFRFASISMRFSSGWFGHGWLSFFLFFSEFEWCYCWYCCSCARLSMVAKS